MPIPLILWAAGAGVVALAARKKPASRGPQNAPGTVAPQAQGSAPSLVQAVPGAPVKSSAKPTLDQALARLRIVARSPKPWLKIPGSVHDPVAGGFGSSSRFMVFQSADLHLSAAEHGTWNDNPNPILASLGGVHSNAPTALKLESGNSNEVKALDPKFWPWNTANDRPNYVNLKNTIDPWRQVASLLPGGFSDTFQGPTPGGDYEITPLPVITYWAPASMEGDKLLGFTRLTDNGWVRVFAWTRKRDLYVPTGLKDIRWPLQSGWQIALQVGLTFIAAYVSAVSGPEFFLAFEVELEDPDFPASQILQVANMVI